MNDPFAPSAEAKAVSRARVGLLVSAAGWGVLTVGMMIASASYGNHRMDGVEVPGALFAILLIAGAVAIAGLAATVNRRSLLLFAILPIGLQSLMSLFVRDHPVFVPALLAIALVAPVYMAIAKARGISPRVLLVGALATGFIALFLQLASVDDPTAFRIGAAACTMTAFLALRVWRALDGRR